MAEYSFDPIDLNWSESTTYPKTVQVGDAAEFRSTINDNFIQTKNIFDDFNTALNSKFVEIGQDVDDIRGDIGDAQQDITDINDNINTILNNRVNNENSGSVYVMSQSDMNALTTNHPEQAPRKGDIWMQII